MTTRIIVTGAPGSGKTALLGALAHGVVVVAEPARELIAEHRVATGGDSLDDLPDLFVERLVARSVEKFDSVAGAGLAVFDRGLPDCVAYAAVCGVDSSGARAAAQRRRYDDPVFVLPPWEEIYATDEMRTMRFQDAQPFHDRIVEAYESLGYDLLEVPRSSVVERARFVGERIGLGV